MIFSRVTTFFILLLSFSSYSIAESVTQKLSDLLKPLQSLSGQFTQTITDSDGEILQSSHGEFWVQRPGRLRWQTQAPYEQLLVTNEENLWLYDPDLEQVTVKVADKSLQQTPAAILSGDVESLNESYLITREAGSAGSDQQVFSLKPIQSGTLFEQLTLKFMNDGITSMELLDSLGQTTTISLSGVTPNTDIEANMFTFSAPPGTDVLIDD